MLQEIYIENFAIIEKLNISFTKGLNVITGETGSGKSIIIEAVELVTGSRFNKGFMGKYKEKCIVEGTFFVDEPIKHRQLEDLGIDVDDDLIVITRQIDTKGKATNRINGRVVNLSTISGVAEILLDIHGQNENQSLLRKDNYINLIDSYNKDNTRKLLDGLRVSLTELSRLQKKLSMMELDDSERDREIDIINFQLDEIDSIDLTRIDEQQLYAHHEKLSNMEEIKLESHQLQNMLHGDGYSNQGVADLLSSISNTMEGIAKLDDDASDLKETMESIFVQMEDFSREFGRYADGLYYDEEELYNLNDTIEKLTSLKRKYGNRIEDILEFRKNISNRLDELDNLDGIVKDLEKQIIACQEMSKSIAMEIRCIRKKTIEILEKKIISNLLELNMKNVDFKVELKDRQTINNTGMDDVDFLIRTNIGSGLKPLTTIASGGEISRIMLGFKSVFADVDSISTLIFDEIDTGISGRTAQVVGEKILDIARNHQVIVISHLPQIAALADNHLLIHKEERDKDTISKVEIIQDEERVDEMSRLIGGVHITETTRKQAREMIDQAKNLKEKKVYI